MSGHVIVVTRRLRVILWLLVIGGILEGAKMIMLLVTR